MTNDTRIPLHVVTGFLGSGKTAVVRHLLRTADASPRSGRIAVLVNEVGALGIDHHLMERLDEEVLALPGGCICCAMRGELYEALDRLLAHRPDRVVLETTGLADPAPLLHTLATDARLAARLRLDGVVAVVDCLRIEDLLVEHGEVRRQLEFADRVLLAKVDLATHRAAGVEVWLGEQVPGREVRTAVEGVVDPDWVFAPAGFGAAGVGLRYWLTDVGALESSHAAYGTHEFRSDTPVDLEALQLWLRLVTQLDGPRLLRIKGLVRCAQDGACYALHAAGRSISPPRRLGRVPDGLRGAEVVVIERALPMRVVEALMDSLRSACAATPRAD